MRYLGKRTLSVLLYGRKRPAQQMQEGLLQSQNTSSVIAKNIQLVASVFKNNDAAFDVKRYRFKDEYFAERGAFYYDTLDRGSIRYSDTLNYPITAPNGDIIYPNGRKDVAMMGGLGNGVKKK